MRVDKCTCFYHTDNFQPSFVSSIHILVFEHYISVVICLSCLQSSSRISERLIWMLDNVVCSHGKWNKHECWNSEIATITRLVSSLSRVWDLSDPLANSITRFMGVVLKVIDKLDVCQYSHLTWFRCNLMNLFCYNCDTGMKF